MNVIKLNKKILLLIFKKMKKDVIIEISEND